MPFIIRSQDVFLESFFPTARHTIHAILQSQMTSSFPVMASLYVNIVVNGEQTCFSSSPAPPAQLAYISK